MRGSSNGYERNLESSPSLVVGGSPWSLECLSGFCTTLESQDASKTKSARQEALRNKKEK